MTRVGAKVLEALGDSAGLRQAACTPRPTSTKKTAILCTSREDNTIMVRQLRLRRKRAAGQEVLRAAHRFLPGPKRGLDGRAYAHPRHCRIPRAKSSTSRPLSRLPAARPTSPCLFLRKSTARRATRSGASATISPGCASVRTAGFGPSTRKTASSALPPAPTKSPTPTLLPPPRKNTIFTNVAHNLDDNTVWWEGLDKNPPDERAQLEGRNSGITASRRQGALIPNSRFTAPAKNCPCLSNEFDNPHGRSDFRYRLRRPPCKDRSAGLPVLRLEARRLRRLHHGFRNHRCRRRCCRRCPPRPDGYASLLRLQHGRLLGSTGWTWARSSATKLPKIFHVNWFRTR